MNVLEQLMATHIAQHGPLDVGQFMSFALSHPEHGYYMKADPFGRGGDFVTAPEVSQMFGEVLGAWSAFQWEAMGRPDDFVLLECGPGRGILMADMLRATQAVQGFYDAAQITLMEISPVLKKEQGDVLTDYQPRWIESLQELPSEVPVIAIGNEFLDALPFRQLEYKQGRWVERVIGFQDDAFTFIHRDAPKAFWPDFGAPHNGDIYEFSSARLGFISQLCERIKETKGAGLFIDYGHGKSGFGDTFQAVKQHGYADILSDVGDVDLTSHVDFEPLLSAVTDVGGIVQPLLDQGDFLRMMGIEARVNYLKSKGAQDIDQDLARLVADDQMGTLFKVMDFRYGY